MDEIPSNRWIELGIAVAIPGEGKKPMGGDLG